jgi:hypothetical protein
MNLLEGFTHYLPPILFTFLLAGLVKGVVGLGLASLRFHVSPGNASWPWR